MVRETLVIAKVCLLQILETLREVMAKNDSGVMSEASGNGELKESLSTFDGCCSSAVLMGCLPFLRYPLSDLPRGTSDIP